MNFKMKLIDKSPSDYLQINQSLENGDTEPFQILLSAKYRSSHRSSWMKLSLQELTQVRDKLNQIINDVNPVRVNTH